MKAILNDLFLFYFPNSYYNRIEIMSTKEGCSLKRILPLYTPEEFDAIALTLLNKYELANLSALLAVEASGAHAENNDYWVTRELLYIDAHTGLTSTTIPK